MVVLVLQRMGLTVERHYALHEENFEQLRKGSVDMLVIFYSINVFITFSLSQAGMVRHWWQERKTERGWQGKLAINAVGLCLTSGILVAMIVQKFTQGGWVTITVTAALVVTAFAIHKHYDEVRGQLKRMDAIMPVMMNMMVDMMDKLEPDVRAGVAEAYANRFSTAQLIELDRFFSTPTGNAYAAQSMLVYTDPAVIERMSKMTPRLVAMMPEMMKKVEAASAAFPPMPKKGQLTKEQRDKLAAMLGG